MTKEEFIKMAALRYNIDRLIAFVNKGSGEAEKVVVEYVKKNHPQYAQAIRYNVIFVWEANGISVGALFKTGGGFSMEEEGEEWKTFRLTYMEVFGWDIGDWAKPTCTKSEANHIVSDTLSQIK